jgi:hypothetical protein
MASSSIDELPHVAEEQRPAKSFDLVHGAGRPSEPKHSSEAPPVAKAPKRPMTEAERLANAERQRRFKERRRAVERDIPESKSETPALSPAIEPEAQCELSEVERAMAFTFSPLRRRNEDST